MASPNKIKGVGYNYKPFEMKAKGYNNSPIEKNFGTPLQRGIATSKGLAGGEPGKPQAKTGVGSALNYAAVGSSPAKGFWDKVKSIGKKVLDPLGLKGKVDKKLGINQKGAEDGSDHTHPEFAELQEAAAAPAAAAEPAAPTIDPVLATAQQAVEKKKKMAGAWGGVLGGAGLSPGV